MLITTLGTSHGNHTYCRFNSSTLLEVGDRSYLIDAGEPVNGLMIRSNKPFSALRAVFITHMHEDHVGGLPDLIKALVKRAEGRRQVRVFLPEPSAAGALSAWVSAMHVQWPSPEVGISGIRGPGQVFDDGVLSVEAIATRHLDNGRTPTFAFLIQAEGRRIISTGDLRADFTDFPETARREPCDLCLCEMTHFKPETALPVLTQSPIRRLILNHIHDPWHGKDGEARLREVLAPLPYPFEIAHDGDAFTL